MDWLLFGIFAVLMLAGVPLAVAMGLAGTVNGDGIHGGVTTISGEEGVRSSSLRGFFYSAEARTLQGAFDAQAPVHRYIGIFDAAGTVRAAQPQRR